MKKALKIIGIIIVALIVLTLGFCAFLAKQPSVPGKYTTSVQTGGDIEAAYLETDSHQVKSYKVDAPEPAKRYHVYLPADLDNGAKCPVVLSVNGTGITADKYPAWFKHLASRGFIVVGTEDPSTGTGQSTDALLMWVLAQGADEASPLFGHVDATNIGLVGHSQGGAGVLMAASVCEHAAAYKTVVALSPTHAETAAALGWTYDLGAIAQPTLLLAGTEGDFETQMVIPLEAMQAMYSELTCPKAMARRIGADHGAMLYSADGYVCAWLMWQLMGDAEAAKAFTGDSPELAMNPLYQDVQIDVR